MVTTLVAVAVVWRYLYHPRSGLLNQLLGVVGIDPIDWLGDPVWAMPALAILAVWKNFGFNMLVFLAGLQAIPERLFEAARLDGAGRWRQLRHVALPMLGAYVRLRRSDHDDRLPAALRGAVCHDAGRPG